MAHEFTACEIFGTRYSSLGKRIETSLPHNEIDYARTLISDLNIFQLCGQLDLELEDEEAELDYLIENRKQFYNNHSYMEKKAIGKANDGPVFVGDTLYRRSNGEKYTVQEDGSITNASGKTKLKAPDLDNFIHFFPKKGERIKNRRKVKPAAITLPKQDNHLVSGPCTKRTPEEAAKAAAKEREQARKEAAKTTEEEKQIVREHYQENEEEAKREVANFLQRRFIHFCEEVAAGRGEAPEVCEFRKYASREILAYLPHDILIYELRSRVKDLPSEKLLQAYTDKELADELRRRGYTVTATKTVEI